MMGVTIDINGITKDKIKISNITEGGASNDRLNQYSVYLNGKSIGQVNHWRSDGSMKLVCKVMKLLTSDGEMK